MTQNIGIVILDYFSIPDKIITKLLSKLDIINSRWLSETHRRIAAKSEVFDSIDEGAEIPYYILEWMPEIESVRAIHVPEPPRNLPNKDGKLNPIKYAKIDTKQDPYRYSERFHAQVDIDIDYLVTNYDEKEMRNYLHDTITNLLSHTITKYRYKVLNV